MVLATPQTGQTAALKVYCRTLVINLHGVVTIVVGKLGPAVAQTLVVDIAWAVASAAKTVIVSAHVMAVAVAKAGL